MSNLQTPLGLTIHLKVQDGLLIPLVRPECQKVGGVAATNFHGSRGGAGVPHCGSKLAPALPAGLVGLGQPNATACITPSRLAPFPLTWGGEPKLSILSQLQATMEKAWVTLRNRNMWVKISSTIEFSMRGTAVSAISWLVPWRFVEKPMIDNV